MTPRFWSKGCAVLSGSLTATATSCSLAGRTIAPGTLRSVSLYRNKLFELGATGVGRDLVVLREARREQRDESRAYARLGK
ncbi:hypothetical protein C8J56DRAFT_935829 [Mycena floridula]|nr:hypothetical protein C8J56DRAFT_935829 [Mycena floridula]